MKDVRVEVCVLGGGPAGLLADSFLRREGVETTLVARSLFGMLTPTRIHGALFTAVPIFINVESQLFRRIPWTRAPVGDSLVVRHVDSDSAPGPDRPVGPGSYAEFLLEHYGGASLPLVLAEKHLGPAVFSDSMPEVRRKVTSHYVNGRPRSQRIGFVEGMSPYFDYLQHESFGHSASESVLRIDVDRKEVLTDKRRIRYSRLISTLPLIHFTRLAGIETPLTTSAAGAQFVILGTDEPVTPNQMLYDCDLSSPVYRVFVPTHGIVVAQRARTSEARHSALPARTQALLGLERLPIILREFAVDACYPLSISDYRLKHTLLADLQRQDVTLFGRFAEWEYRDLDELDWERIT